MMPSALPEHGKTSSASTDRVTSKPTSVIQQFTVPYRDGDTVNVNYGPPRPFVPQLRKTSNSGRNDPCPCGSGKKFKNCHWRRKTR